MNKTEKGQVIEEVRESLSQASVAIVTHYRGMTVAEMTKLRRSLRDAGAEFRVVKNTLARRASQGTPFEPLSPLLTGPTGIAYSADPVAPAKALSQYAKQNPKLEILGGVLDGKAMDAAGVQALAELPSREVLVAQLLGVLNGPIRNFVGVLAAVPGGFVRALDQVRQQKEQASTAP
ncbi:MAG: 50S ribosomal protein L10 [Magnetococcus sp. WYHC-3]